VFGWGGADGPLRMGGTGSGLPGMGLDGDCAMTGRTVRRAIVVRDTRVVSLILPFSIDG
jgi:hypothetical protein